MTDERGIGPMPPVVMGDEAAEASVTSGVVAARVAGAALGGILAVVAIGLAVRVDAALASNHENSPIAVVFGPGGIAGDEPLGTLLVWAVGPLAALIAGWFLAEPAVRGVDGSGLWMGLATYVVAIGIAPVVFLPGMAAVGFSDLGGVAALPFVWAFADAALAPLLVVCLIAGPVWAVVLRRTTGGAAVHGTSTRSLPIWPIVAITILTFIGWTLVAMVIGTTGNATFD